MRDGIFSNVMEQLARQNMLSHCVYVSVRERERERARVCVCVFGRSNKKLCKKTDKRYESLLFAKITNKK